MTQRVFVGDGEKRRVLLSTLWIVVLFNMVFADIVGLLNPGTIEQMMTMHPSPGLLAAFTLLLEIPIAMILLSRILRPAINRWANIVAGLLTIAWIVGGGNTSLTYLIFGSVEVLCLGFIVRLAWTWKEEA